MRSSFEYIISRQKRKGIPSIINGVHVVPETLNGLDDNQNMIFINLYIHSEKALYTRLVDRNPESYMIDHVPFIFQTNMDLYASTELSRRIIISSRFFLFFSDPIIPKQSKNTSVKFLWLKFISRAIFIGLSTQECQLGSSSKSIGITIFFKPLAYPASNKSHARRI